MKNHSDERHYLFAFLSPSELVLIRNAAWGKITNPGLIPNCEAAGPKQSPLPLWPSAAQLSKVEQSPSQTALALIWEKFNA